MHTNKHVGILLCDDLVGLLPPDAPPYGTLFEGLLKRVNPGFTFTEYPVFQGVLPKSVGECQGYVVTGSRAGAYDTYPWIPPLFAFIRQAAADGAPLTGTCFGHQAVALALGGAVEKSSKGWGLGVYRNPLQADTLNFGLPQKKTLSLLYSHQDQVTHLPPGAAAFMEGGFCTYPGFVMGRNILTLQGHPEFTKEMCRCMIRQNSYGVAEDRQNQALESLSLPTDEVLAARLMAAVLAKR